MSTIVKSLRRRSAVLVKCASLSIMVALTSHAPIAYAFSWQPSQLQYALMPDHCKANMSNYLQNRNGAWKIKLPINEAQIKYWRQKVGRDFNHMHHYCAGLGWLMQAESPSYKKKAWAYQQAEGEIAYTIGRSNPKSPLWLEMNIAQAKAKAGLQKQEQAIAQLTRLQSQYPSSPDVYITIAQILKRQGRTEKAITVLEDGMRKTSQKGPLLFYLARYYYDVGDIRKAAELTPIAEAQGMKMDSLKALLPTPVETK